MLEESHEALLKLNTLPIDSIEIKMKSIMVKWRDWMRFRLKSSPNDIDDTYFCNNQSMIRWNMLNNDLSRNAMTNMWSNQTRSFNLSPVQENHNRLSWWTTSSNSPWNIPSKSPLNGASDNVSNSALENISNSASNSTNNRLSDSPWIG